MKYATPSAFRAALEQRLLTIAQQTGVPLLRLRKLVVFDRLMARLMVAAPNRWVVKGAAALLFRIGTGFRTTKDLDLGRQDNLEAATADFSRRNRSTLATTSRSSSSGQGDSTRRRKIPP